MAHRLRNRYRLRSVMSFLVLAVGASLAATVVVPSGADAQTFEVSSAVVSSATPSRATPSTVTGQALPTWQIDGVVWDTVTVGETVYAVGQFGYARPPGTARTSSKRVARRNILAFDITTGVITEFKHSLNGPGYRIAASPDGRTIYVGGSFTKVDGKTRSRLAAFDEPTGELSDTFRPSLNGSVRALAVSGSTVYAGGGFTTSGGKTRKSLAAFARSDGRLRSWRPTTAQGNVYALAVLPGGRRIAVGGSFQKVNGKAKVGIGAVDASTGVSRRWKSRPIPSRIGKRDSLVSDLIVSGSVVYATAVGNGGHWFDGRFAARASDGALVWLDNCYGATLSGYVTGRVFYSVGHAHNCSSLGAFPEKRPDRHYQALAETTYATRTDRTRPGNNANYKHTRTPSLLHWFPTLGPGSFTGRNQAAWAITGNGTYVALAGEFVTVNGVKQQGLTRFAIRSVDPAGSPPKYSASMKATPTVLSGGKARITWRETWDREDPRLTYSVQRRVDVTQPWIRVGKVAASSRPWLLGRLSISDKGLAKGTRYEYRVVVSDPAGNSYPSAPSKAVVAR